MRISRLSICLDRSNLPHKAEMSKLFLKKKLTGWLAEKNKKTTSVKVEVL